ncbi:uncharacterized protein LOC117176419 [Belonocnema kinseyi]|uniref:uncharacterized protein LOC117176419 n=1 Tax=Belonocnema kinseyi TaxID=2817044 RepID=UPI00143D1E00|nr:uncharacterized protein LOC117176419 [Belonocnema kinseyi]
MRKQSSLNLVIACVVLGQGIAVLCEENKDTSSAFLLREKPPTGPTVLHQIFPRKLPNRVRVMRGTDEVGIGLVIHRFVIATKASIFQYGVQYHVEFPGPTGGTVRHKLTHIQLNVDYERFHENPGGIHDVALAGCNGPMPKNDFTLNMLQEAGDFTPTQIAWIASKT